MGLHKALKAHVEMSLAEDGSENEVGFFVSSPDGSALTGNQIVEAIAEAVLILWENNPIEPRSDSEFDA